MSHLKPIFAAILFVLLAGCAEPGHDEPDGGRRPGTGAATTLLVRSGYDYAPSVIRDGNLEHYWWCGSGRAPDGKRVSDVIYYRARNVETDDWATDIQMVLWPTAGTWDQWHVCDPAVVRGHFVDPAGGPTYTFALYYTGTEASPGNNDIGVAFSNDGRHWVKYGGNPVVSPQIPGTGTYGAGQPAVVNVDRGSTIHLFHTDTTVSGNRMYVRRSPDGIHFGPPTQLPLGGMPGGMANSDIAYDPSTGLYYGALGLPGRPGDRDTYHFGLYSIPAGDLLNGKGTWHEISIVDTGVTGWYLNHSPGIRHDGYGNVGRWLPSVRIVFGAGGNHPFTWDLRQVELALDSKNPG